MATRLNLAEAQFIGFHHGKYGYTVRQLVTSMGLTRSEWLKIREHSGLDESDMEDIDELLKVKAWDEKIFHQKK